MLPLQNIQNGLEKFFKDTLERNGKGRRADVIVPVDEYGSNTSTGNSGHDHLLSGIHYGLWFHDYGMMYPVLPETSENSRVWSSQWVDMGQNVQLDHSMYNNVNQSPPSSVNRVTSFPQTNAASVKEKWKSRGTGTYIPNLVRYFLLFGFFFLFS